jgi:hypothetical protein
MRSASEPVNRRAPEPRNANGGRCCHRPPPCRIFSVAGSLAGQRPGRPWRAAIPCPSASGLRLRPQELWFRPVCPTFEVCVTNGCPSIPRCLASLPTLGSGRCTLLGLAPLLRVRYRLQHPVLRKVLRPAIRSGCEQKVSRSGESWKPPKRGIWLWITRISGRKADRRGSRPAVAHRSLRCRHHQPNFAPGKICVRW